MNPLLLDDLFVTICHYLDIKNVIHLELVSKEHSLLIRKTPWYQKITIINDNILKHIVTYYKFKHLRVDFYNVNSYIDYLKDCHTLDLSHCKNITDEGFKALKHCHTLYLRFTNITDEGVKALKDCHTLHLCGTNITDEGFKALKNCHKLHLNYTNITDEGVKALKDCHTLNIIL